MGALFSHDRARHTIVFRQFHQEGFVNQYVTTPGSAGTLVFETFELASGGGSYAVYSKARFKRVRR